MRLCDINEENALRISFDFHKEFDTMINLLIVILNSGGSRIFPTGVRQLPKVLFSIFCRKLLENENLTKSYVGAPLVGRRPLLQGILDPPLPRIRQC